MKLLQPLKIGDVALKNRIVMPAVQLGYCKGGYISEQIINFYRERARGGAGLILVGGCGVNPYPGYWGMVELGDDKFIPGHRQLVNTVHEAGARIGAQLIQQGRNDRSDSRQPIAPSAIPSTLTRVIPKEMTLEDINEVIGHFASSARRAKEAGYDLVEVIAGGGYLISQFLSPITNHRTDHYGGSFENRTRFGEEVIRSVRQAVGTGFTIMVRLSGNEFMPGGNTNLEAREFARRLQEAGADAFNVTGGWHETSVPQITMNVPAGAYVYLARGIKQAVDVPVLACNRINDPLLAEKILVQGSADMVGMARPLIADPDLPRKVMEGRYNEIRKCVGCNQGCLDQIFQEKSCTCLVNSQVGREAETEIKPAAIRKKVLIIGGGPAGMEAARVAASRGHGVTLWEKRDRLGGQLLKAGAVPDRADLLNLVDFLKESLSVLGVEVELNKEASAELIRSFAPDFVVFASGATPAIPPIPGIKSGHVVEAGEVLTGQAELGRRVVIIGGGAVGCEMGVYIAHQGTINSDTIRFLLLNEAETVETIKKIATHGTKEVVILEMDKTAGKGLGISTRWIILQELKRMGVKILTSTTAKSIVPEGVLVDRPNGQQEMIPADSVVVAIGSRSERALYEELKHEFPAVCLVGDANQVRTALEAIREGFDAGYAI